MLWGIKQILLPTIVGRFSHEVLLENFGKQKEENVLGCIHSLQNQMSVELCRCSMGLLFDEVEAALNETVERFAFEQTVL